MTNFLQESAFVFFLIRCVKIYMQTTFINIIIIINYININITIYNIINIIFEANLKSIINIVFLIKKIEIKNKL